jgi:3-dehydroquinate dehydratase
MSTKAIREALEELTRHGTTDCGAVAAAREVMRKHVAALAELEAIEEAAKDLDRLGIGDFTYTIRDRVSVIASTHNSESTWNHPDVKAWSDASVLLATIAKES